jgi:hypothetical protein
LPKLNERFCHISNTGKMVRIAQTMKGDSIMREVIYTLRFRGKAAPFGTSGNLLKAATTAPSTSFTSRIGPDGLSSSSQPADGGEATFESEVSFTGETSFLETGTISFGDGNSVRFSTVGSGYLDSSAQPGIKHGSVIWRIEDGSGQFAGATGLITSNFFVTESLEVTDHHFGVLLLP